MPLKLKNCGECSVNHIFQCVKCLFFMHDYFSSFEAGNCDPQLQVGENYFYLFLLESKHLQIWMFEHSFYSS